MILNVRVVDLDSIQKFCLKLGLVNLFIRLEKFHIAAVLVLKFLISTLRLKLNFQPCCLGALNTPGFTFWLLSIKVTVINYFYSEAQSLYWTKRLLFEFILSDLEVLIKTIASTLQQTLTNLTHSLFKVRVVYRRKWLNVNSLRLLNIMALLHEISYLTLEYLDLQQLPFQIRSRFSFCFLKFCFHFLLSLLEFLFVVLTPLILLGQLLPEYFDIFCKPSFKISDLRGLLQYVVIGLLKLKTHILNSAIELIQRLLLFAQLLSLLVSLVLLLFELLF